MTIANASIAQSGADIRLSGVLTVDNAADLFATQIDYNHSRLKIDLAELAAVDSAGIALLVYWRQQANARGCALHFVHLDNQVSSMLRISKLKSMLSG